MIRRATQKDIEGLVKICKESFPGSIRWQNPSLQARRWWTEVIGSLSSETWVCVNNCQIVGLCLLVLDEALYAKEKRQLGGSVFARVCALIISPRVVVHKICEIIADSGSGRGKDFPINIPAPRINKRAWIELIAVALQARGQGLAKEMLQFCVNRALQLGREGIQLSTGAANKAAISCYEKSGFVRTAKKSGKYNYTKLLRSQNSWRNEKDRCG